MGVAIEMWPVLEGVHAEVMPFDLWPVAWREPWWARLGPGMADAEVGGALWSVLFWNRETDWCGEAALRDVDAAIAALARATDPYLAGGLCVVRGGVRIDPGCCCGLEDWRTWLDVFPANWAEIGHDGPGLETVDGVVRLSERATAEDEIDYDSPWFELPGADLFWLLAGVERDLRAFVELTRSWVARRSPEHADAVATALARSLHVGD